MKGNASDVFFMKNVAVFHIFCEFRTTRQPTITGNGHADSPHSADDKAAETEAEPRFVMKNKGFMVILLLILRFIANFAAYK